MRQATEIYAREFDVRFQALPRELQARIEARIRDRLPPRPGFEITVCDLKAADPRSVGVVTICDILTVSSAFKTNTNSAGNRAGFRFTAWFRVRVSTP